MGNLSALWKGVIMTVVTIIATAISTGGLPTTTLGWTTMGITVLGTVLIYLAKNAVFPSVSILGSVNLKDVLSGLILAVGSGLSSWVASLTTGTPVNWHSLITLAVSVAIGYLAKTFATGTTPTPPPAA